MSPQTPKTQTLSNPQEKEDAQAESSVRLGPIANGIVGPLAEPVATAKRGHLMAGEEKRDIHPDEIPNHSEVAQVGRSLRLDQRKRDREEGKG